MLNSDPQPMNLLTRKKCLKKAKDPIWGICLSLLLYWIPDVRHLDLSFVIFFLPKARHFSSNYQSH